MTQRKWFYLTVGITVLIRCIVAIYLPITGDEAYYAIWGKFLSWGYYDHTPLIGWVLYLVLHGGSSCFWLRLPTIFTTTAIGCIIYYVLKPHYPDKAAPIAILYLISPLNLCGMLISTDIPLIFFSFLSGIFVFYALHKKDHLLYYLLSGVCLGLAFFSKYFAVLLGLAYFLFFIFSKKSWKRTIGFILLFLCVLPFGLANLYWNYTHAWANILFNVYTRNSSMHFMWHTIGLYILILFYIITPPICYYLIKHVRAWRLAPQPKAFAIFIAASVIPLCFFLMLSSVKSIGLHWPLSFIPFIYLILPCYLSRVEIKRCIIFMIVFTALHLLLCAAILYTPVQTWQKFGIKNRTYAELVFNIKPAKVIQHLDRYKENFILASPSYSKADMIYYYTGHYSPTFGHGSVHGRQGDFLTDFRTMDGKNFILFDTKQPDRSEIAPYFDYVHTETFMQDGAVFYITFAFHFHYLPYRDTVLRQINQRYWQVPEYLPHTASFYCEKYFQSEGCPSHELVIVTL